MLQADFRVDNASHLLYLGARAFSCDREIVAARRWHDHVLLLSADTDCLSLWDDDGLIRTARVGVYPQDVDVYQDIACVCGGTDGKLHLLSLPGLRETVAVTVPGMPERICIASGAAWVLSLLAEAEACTALLRADLSNHEVHEVTRFAGIPGSLNADDCGLWVGVTELVMRLPWGSAEADVTIEGFGLPERIEQCPGGILVTDSLEGRQSYIRTEKSARLATSAL